MSTPANPENQPPKDGGNPQTFTQEFQLGSVGARVPEKVARGVFATGALVIQGASEFVIDFLLRMNQPHQIVARVILPINLVPQLIELLHVHIENYRKANPTALVPAPAPPAAPNTLTASTGAPVAPAASAVPGPAAAHGAAGSPGMSAPPGASAAPAAPGTPPPPGAPVTPGAPAMSAPPSIEEIYHELKMSDDVMVGAYANAVMVVYNASEFCLEFISRVYPRPVITARVFLSAPQMPILLNSINQSWQNLRAKMHPPPGNP